MRRFLLFALLLSCTTGFSDSITVQGRVLLPDKRTPAEGATVHLIPFPSPYQLARAQWDGSGLVPHNSTKTDGDGTFQLLADRAGLWLVRIEGSGYVPLEGFISPLVEDIYLPEAILQPVAVVSIRVTQRGKPVARELVMLTTELEYTAVESFWLFPKMRWGITDEQGQTTLPAGTTEFFNISIRGVERNGVRAGQVSIEIGTRRRELRVVSKDKKPLQGILARGSKTGYPFGLTDSEGRVSVWGKEVVLIAEDGRILESVSSTGTVVFPEPATVTGRVIDEQTRGPVANALVWSTSCRWIVSFTDSQGVYRLKGSPGSNHYVRIVSSGYLDEQIPDLTFGNQTLTIALTPASTVEGRVIDESGRALANVNLEAIQGWGSGKWRTFRRPGSPRLVSSSSQGNFRFSRMDPASSYRIVARKPGFATKTVEIDPGQKSIKIVLVRGVAVHGMVVNEKQEPVQDAVVSFRTAVKSFQDLVSETDQEEVITGKDGVFSLSALNPGNYDVEVVHPAYARKKIKAIQIPSSNKPAVLDKIVLQQGLILQGRILNQAQQPVEGAKVFLAEPDPWGISRWYEKNQPDAISGTGGWFLVSGLGEGDIKNIIVTHPSYVEKTVKQVKLPITSPLEIVLQTASEISGKVVDQQNQPIAGAKVSLAIKNVQAGRTRLNFLGSKVSNPEGDFRFSGVKPDTYLLHVVAEGFITKELQGIEIPEGKNRDDLKIVLQPGSTLEGTVKLPDGNPAIGVRIEKLEEEKERAWIYLSNVFTDGDGKYRLTGLPPGNVTIQAEDRNYGRVVKDIEIQPGINRLDLMLEGGYTVSGKVVDEAGAAIAGVEIRLLNNWYKVAITNEDGSFQLKNVPNGEHAFQVNKVGYADLREEVKVKVEGADVSGLQIVLKKGGAVFGTIIGVKPEQYHLIGVEAWSYELKAWSETSVDYKGNYRFENLAPGRWSITARLAETGKQASGAVVVPENGGEAKLDLEFGKGLKICGQAFLGKKPLSSAEIWASGKDVDSFGSARTDFEGRYQIEGLVEGKHVIGLRDESGISYSQEMELTFDQEINIHVPELELYGTVVDSVDGFAVEGAVVQITAPPGSDLAYNRIVHTDSEGRFKMVGVVQGNWQLIIKKSGYAVHSSFITIDESREEQRIQLAPTEGLYLEVIPPFGSLPSEVWIVLVDAAGAVVLSGLYPTRENGFVRVSSAPAGQWELMIRAANAAWSVLPVTVPGPKVKIQLRPFVDLSILVPQLEQENVLGKAQLLGADGKAFLFFRSLRNQVLSEEEVNHGRATFYGVPEGDWTVVVRTPDGRRWEKQIRLQSGQSADVVLN